MPEERRVVAMMTAAVLESLRERCPQEAYEVEYGLLRFDSDEALRAWMVLHEVEIHPVRDEPGPGPDGGPT